MVYPRQTCPKISPLWADGLHFGLAALRLAVQDGRWRPVESCFLTRRVPGVYSGQNEGLTSMTSVLVLRMLFLASSSFVHKAIR